MQDTTKKLMDILKNTGRSEIDGFEKKYLDQKPPTFFEFIDRIISKKKLKRQNIIIKANLPQKYGYKLLSGETHTTDRDKILRLCLSMEMNLEEVQTALKLYGVSELYPKLKRDAMLIVAINNKMYWVDEVNDWLVEQGEEPLE